MALSVREQILAAIATRLGTVSGVVAVVRNRRNDLNIEEFPGLVVLDGGHQAADDENAGFTRYILTVQVEGYVGAVNSVQLAEADLGPAISALYASSLAVLMADRTLGGLAVDLHEGALDVAIDREDGHPPAGGFMLEIIVDYFTKTADPFTVGP